jgi:hypothetical protein
MVLSEDDLRPSASDVGPWELCPATRALELREEDDSFKPWLWWGIFLHRFLEYINRRKYPRMLGLALAIHPDEIPSGTAELAFGHDPEMNTARCLVYPQRVLPGEWYSRADLVWSEQGIICFTDWKSGGPRDWDPATDEQILGIACGLRRLLDDEGPIVGGFRFVESDGVITSSEHAFTALEMDAFDDRLRRALPLVRETRLALRQGAPVEFVPGEQCEWCDLRSACPAAPPEADE